MYNLRRIHFSFLVFIFLTICTFQYVIHRALLLKLCKLFLHSSDIDNWTIMWNTQYRYNTNVM